MKEPEQDMETVRIVSYGVCQSSDVAGDGNADRLEVIYVVYEQNERLHCYVKAGVYHGVIRIMKTAESDEIEMEELLEQSLRNVLGTNLQSELTAVEVKISKPRRKGLWHRFTEWLRETEPTETSKTEMTL